MQYNNCIIQASIVGNPSLVSSMSGVIFAGGLFWLINKLFPRSLGLGEAKFVTGLGAYLGLAHVLVALCLGFLAVSLSGLVILKRQSNTKYIPFGPFLALGAWISIGWGPLILPG